eukprot:scaffold45193_cov43-Phaeocystis_antarctica.AAC.1
MSTATRTLGSKHASAPVSSPQACPRVPPCGGHRYLLITPRTQVTVHRPERPGSVAGATAVGWQRGVPHWLRLRAGTLDWCAARRCHAQRQARRHSSGRGPAILATDQVCEDEAEDLVCEDEAEDLLPMPVTTNTTDQVCEDEAEDFQIAKENLENVEMD